MKTQHDAGPVLPRIPFLGFRPRQRVKDSEFILLVGKHTGRFQRGSDFLRHRLNLRPGWRDHQRASILVQGFQVRLCSRVANFVAGKFHDRTHPFQLREGFDGALLRRQFDRTPILGPTLPPDARQLTRLQA